MHIIAGGSVSRWTDGRMDGWMDGWEGENENDLEKRENLTTREKEERGKRKGFLSHLLLEFKVLGFTSRLEASG